MDSHVHVTSIDGVGLLRDGGNSYHEAMIKSYFKQLPRSYLYYGYTRLVDLVSADPDRLTAFRGEPLHPDLYDCNPSMPFANGYPTAFAPPEVRFKLFPNFICDPSQATNIPAEYKPEDHTPAADVARVKRVGGICVKTFFERGFGPDKRLPVQPEVLAQIRKAATENGLVLMIHANGLEGQKFAADGDVDVIVHGMWHWEDLDKQTRVPDEIKQVLD